MLLHKSAFLWVYMKRLTGVLVAVLLLCGFTSCDSGDITQSSKEIIAVSQDLYCLSAANSVSADVQEVVTYNTASDVVVAVENSKADYGIIDEFDTFDFISANRRIKVLKECDYTAEFSFFFNENCKTDAENFNDAIMDLKSNGVLQNIKDSYIETGAYNCKIPDGKKTLVFGCDPAFEHRAEIDEGGTVSGIDISVVTEICSRLGYSLEIVTGDYDDLFYKLSKGKIDFVAAQVDESHEKEKEYIATEPYLTYKFNLIVKE